MDALTGKESASEKTVGQGDMPNAGDQGDLGGGTPGIIGISLQLPKISGAPGEATARTRDLQSATNHQPFLNSAVDRQPSSHRTILE